jgi:hypothetical protein
MSPDFLFVIVGMTFAIVIGLDIYNWLKDREFVAPEIRIERFWKKIKLSTLVIGMVCLMAAVLFNINLLDYRSPVEYAKWKSITMRDFRGFKLPNQKVHGISTFAFISTSIDWDKNDGELTITSYFHPSRSYSYSDKKDDLLLSHEMYHFHITEYFARKCREQLSGFEIIPDASEIKKVIETNLLLEEEMQIAYDDETYHSYVMQKQKSWEIKIDSLLSSTQKYRDPKLTYK